MSPFGHGAGGILPEDFSASSRISFQERVVYYQDILGKRAQQEHLSVHTVLTVSNGFCHSIMFVALLKLAILYIEMSSHYKVFSMFRSW